MSSISQSTLVASLAQASVPGFNCPPGTKLHLLDLGTLQCDEGWLLRGANSSLQSQMKPESKRRDLITMAALIEHPEAGLILFETGCAEDLNVQWGPPLIDIFPRVHYEDKHKLPAAIKATGNDIKDVKMVIMGHLHLDHAGGLEHFIGTEVPIYVHEEEFKHACWAVGTGMDHGVYLGSYLQLEKLNWKTFPEATLDLFKGVSLHHCPGHTPGLCAMQVNLEKDGTFIFTTDQFHVIENYELGQPQGWLARDHNAWFRSYNLIQRLKRLYNATLVFGHDKEVFDKLVAAKTVYN